MKSLTVVLIEIDRIENRAERNNKKTFCYIIWNVRVTVLSDFGKHALSAKEM